MEGKPLLTSKQKTEVVCGVPTQVVCTAFSSHILVVVTQFGKMGTLVSLEPSNAAGDISKPVLTTKVLLGQDEVKRLGTGPVVEGRPRAAVTCQGHGVSGRQGSPPLPSIFWGPPEYEGTRLLWGVLSPAHQCSTQRAGGGVGFVTWATLQFDSVAVLGGSQWLSLLHCAKALREVRVPLCRHGFRGSSQTRDP